MADKKKKNVVILDSSKGDTRDNNKRTTRRFQYPDSDIAKGLQRYESGYNKSGAKIDSVTNEQSDSQYAYDNYMQRVKALKSNTSATRDHLASRISDARKDGYYAKQYIANHADSLDRQYYSGYARDLMKNIQAATTELNSIEYNAGTTYRSNNSNGRQNITKQRSAQKTAKSKSAQEDKDASIRAAKERFDAARQRRLEEKDPEDKLYTIEKAADDLYNEQQTAQQSSEERRMALRANQTKDLDAPSDEVRQQLMAKHEEDEAAKKAREEKYQAFKDSQTRDLYLPEFESKTQRESKAADEDKSLAFNNEQTKQPDEAVQDDKSNKIKTVEELEMERYIEQNPQIAAQVVYDAKSGVGISETQFQAPKIQSDEYSSDYSTFLTQISDDIANKTIDPGPGYEYCKKRVNEYAKQNYMQDYSIVDQYEKVAHKKDALLVGERKKFIDEGIADPPTELIEYQMYLNTHKDEYEEAKQRLENIYKGESVVDQLLSFPGVNGDDNESVFVVMNYAYLYGSDYRMTNWNGYTNYQEASFMGFEQNDVVLAARKGKTEIQKEISRVTYVLEKLDTMDIKIDSKYKKNLIRYKAKLERDLEDADYFLLCDNEDFLSVVSDVKANLTEVINKSPVFLSNRGEYTTLDFSMIKPFYGFKKNYAKYMTEDERDTFLYLLGKQGEQAAEEYYNHLCDTTYGVVPTRLHKNFITNTKKEADEHPVSTSILAHIASPLQAIGLLYSIQAALTGKEINPNNPAFIFSTAINIADKNMESKIDEEFGKDSFEATLAHFGYDAATNIVDNGMGVMLGGGSAIAVTSIMASEASAVAIQNAKIMGASDSQALMMGGATLVAETVTEFIPVGKARSMISNGATGKLRGLILNACINMGTDAFNKSLTTTLETISDELIMGELSKYNTAVSMYIDTGMSPEKAQEQATLDVVNNIIYSGIVEAFSSDSIKVGTFSLSMLQCAIDKAINLDTGEADSLPMDDDIMSSVEDTSNSSHKSNDTKVDVTSDEKNSTAPIYPVSIKTQSVDVMQNKALISSTVEDNAPMLMDTQPESANSLANLQTTASTLGGDNAASAFIKNYDQNTNLSPQEYGLEYYNVMEAAQKGATLEQVRSATKLDPIAAASAYNAGQRS